MYLRLVKFVFVISAFVLLFQPVLPVLEYALDYTYISQVLCINKEKPQSNCNGKCHLGKQLAKEFGSNDADSQTPSKPTKQKQKLDWFFTSRKLSVQTLLEMTVLPNKIILYFGKDYQFWYQKEVWNPPKHTLSFLL